MADKHIAQLDGFIKEQGNKVVEDFRYLCFKKFSLIYDYEVLDLFNDIYLKICRALIKKDEDYVVDVAKYTYHSLRMEAIRVNKNRGKKNKKMTELMDWHEHKQVPDEDDEVDPFRIAVYKEAIRFIEEQFPQRKIDAFKFRVLSGMSWNEMAESSGYSKVTLMQDFNTVADAIHKHFKANKLRDIKLKEIIK
jgi:hypothetical protein